MYNCLIEVYKLIPADEHELKACQALAILEAMDNSCDLGLHSETTRQMENYWHEVWTIESRLHMGE